MQTESFYSTGQTPTRKTIFDRNGYILATTIPTMSIYADPSIVSPDHDEALSTLFAEYKVKIATARRNRSRFLWLERHSDRVSQIRKLRIPGIYARSDMKRVYPWGSLFSTIIGFCDHNNHGKHGVEYAMNATLQSADVQLSLDLHLQSILHTSVSTACSDFEGEGASGLILDVRSGRILAMVSVPMPAQNVDFLDIANRNRNLDPVEVGSVLKLVNTAIAIESGQYTLESEVDARGPLKVDRFEINDFFGVNRVISLRESLWRSSNIAHARVAWSLGKAVQQRFFRELGLLDKIEWLPKSYVAPIVAKRWTKPTIATLAYGYGVAITTLHLARAILAIVTGKRMDLSCLQNMSDVKNRPARVFSRDTVRTMRELMEYVTTHGYKQTLWLPDCRVGAKTGTANMTVNGKYIQGQNFVTLATVFPMEAPQYICILQMSNPKKHRLKRGRFTVAGNVLSTYMKDLVRQCMLCRTEALL